MIILRTLQFGFGLWVFQSPERLLVLGFQNCLPPGTLDDVGRGIFRVELEVKEDRSFSCSGIRWSWASVDSGSLDGFVEEWGQLVSLITSSPQTVVEGSSSFRLVICIGAESVDPEQSAKNHAW